MTMGMNQVKAADVSALDSVAECDDLHWRLTETIADLEAQQVDHLNGEGPSRPSGWMGRLMYALRMTKAKRLLVERRRAEIRREDMARSGVVPERVFQQVAHQMLAPDVYGAIMEAVRERIGHEVQG